MENNDERRVYELGYHMVPTLTEDELQKEADSLRGALSKLEGNTISESEPTAIELAYTMVINEGGKNTKYDTSFFGWIKFDMMPDKIDHLQTEVLADNKNILRYLLIKTVTEDTQAQVNLEELEQAAKEESLNTESKLEEKSEEKVKETKKTADKDLDSTIDKLLEE